MSDIYLPKKQMEDLKMFINVYSNNSEILRYLLVGVPGTGKTEACLTLMNELKKKKVTIIKTPICKYLSEKVNLAILLRPSIIIFDDLDLSLGSRNSGGYSNMLQTFLDILDGTDKLPKDVGILATTNSAFLLDLAAQRPGRFDKVMIFDELTKENIMRIILKSLKFNFNLTDKKDTEVFINSKVIDKYFTSQVTGAHIYNSISMMKLKCDMITKGQKKQFEVTVDWLLEEIENEIKILDKIKAQQKINDRLNNSGATRKIGFGNDEIDIYPCEDEKYGIDEDMGCDSNCDENLPMRPSR
jgi:SpoVK/Ycf46/Vps4 family AAA+-type ATPase